MGRIEHVAERAVVRCLVYGCGFVQLDTEGSSIGIDEAKRHADAALQHLVEVKIDVTLMISPVTTVDDEGEEEDEEEGDDDQDDGDRWVGTGDCENCSRDDVDLHDWAGMSICVDCLMSARARGFV